MKISPGAWAALFATTLAACLSTDNPSSSTGGPPSSAGGGGGDPSQPAAADADSGTDTIPMAGGGDFGDAPDGRVRADGTFTGDGYPTLFASGGAHTLDTTAVALADGVANATVSPETDADDLRDPDGRPNTLRFVESRPDSANQDDFDNGIVRATLASSVSGPALDVVVGAALQSETAAGTYYLNVLFDQDVDGAWNGSASSLADSPAQQATDVDLTDEWIVKNMAVELNADVPFRELNFSLPLAGTLAADWAIAAPYMRLALTDEPIDVAVWRGEGEFERGEIEDWAVLGLDDPPRLQCQMSAAPGLYQVDFESKDEAPLACSVIRPRFSPPAEPIDFFFEFDQVFPAGGPDVGFDCARPPMGGVVSAGPNQATQSAPLDLGCTAEKLGDVRTRQPLVRIDLESEFADQGRASTIGRGFGSEVRVLMSLGRAYVLFVDTPLMAPPSDIEDCIGQTGSHDNINGGQLVQDPRTEASAPCSATTA